MTDPRTPTQPTNSDLEAVLSRPAIHENDRVPNWLLRASEWAARLLPYQRRAVIGIVIIVVAVVGALLLSSTHFIRTVIEALDMLSFAGLFLVNWIGNGGVLVPVPGARFLGLLMIFQHAVIFPSWEVTVVSGVAMALGLVSYYLAGARSAAAYERGDAAAAAAILSDATAAPDVSDSDSDEKPSRRTRVRTRFSESWKAAQAKAHPIIEKRGVSGMFWLCFVPSPAATAAAFLGGAMRFGFARFLAADFASKFLLAAVIAVAGMFFSEQASSVELPF